MWNVSYHWQVIAWYPDGKLDGVQDFTKTSPWQFRVVPIDTLKEYFPAMGNNLQRSTRYQGELNGNEAPDLYVIRTMYITDTQEYLVLLLKRQFIKRRKFIISAPDELELALSDMSHRKTDE